jgi:CheY-like chemotaxis protein
MAAREPMPNRIGAFPPHIVERNGSAVLVAALTAPFGRLIRPNRVLHIHRANVIRAPQRKPRLQLHGTLPPRLALVVEDDPDTQSALAAYLEQDGWEIELASDGDDALRITRERRPELVCLDLNLPDISGYDVCERIRSDPALAGTIIVMMSARATIDVRAYSLEAGADAYLAKPYELEELSATIERFFATRPSRLVAIVDDDHDIRQVVRGLLEEEGYSTIEAANGREALDLLRRSKSKPDLILLDLMMPMMDGWQLRARLHEDPALQEIPIVIMTAHGGMIRAVRSAVPDTPVLTKPLELDHLLEVVAAYSAKRCSTPET